MRDPKGTSMSEMYNQYVDYYNSAGKKIIHHIPVLSEFSNIEKSLSERIAELREDFKESINNLEEILDEKIEEKESVKSDSISKDLRESKEEMLSRLRYYIYYDYISSFEQQKEYVFSLLSRFYDENEADDEFEMIKIYIEVSKEKVLKFKKIQGHEVVIANLKREIVDKFYPDQLDYYKDLSEVKKEELAKAYSPHHNTREDLIKDLREIILDVQDQRRFFHDDGTIKHTTVAKHAISQDWFSDKHGHNTRGLHKHIKKLFESM